MEHTAPAPRTNSAGALNPVLRSAQGKEESLGESLRGCNKFTS